MSWNEKVMDDELTAMLNEAIDEPAFVALRPLLEALRDRLAAISTALDAVQTERDMYKMLLDLLPHTAVYMKDLEGRKLYSNQLDARAMGVSSPEEALGKTDFDVYPIELAERFTADDRMVIESRQPLIDREELLHDPDGREVWWLTNKQPMFDDQGNVIGLIGVGRDITHRKQAELRLLQSEREYRALFDAALRQSRELNLLDNVRNILASETDLSALFKTICESIAQNFGYTHVSVYLLEGERLVLQHQFGYATPMHELPIYGSVSGRVVRTGRPTLLEDVSTDPDFQAGITGITSEICVPLKDGERPVGILNIESIDGRRLTHADLDLMIALSEHVSIAINRARLIEELRESEAATRALIDAIPDLIMRFDRDGRYLWVKPRHFNTTPIITPSEQMLNRTIFDVMSPEFAAKGMELIRLAHETGEVQLTEYPLAHEGAVYWFEARIVPTVHDETLVIVRDITDRKNAERHREETERMNILKELFDNLSHDLRTPIASIVTSIYLLQKQNEQIIKHNRVLSARSEGLPPELNTLIQSSTHGIQHAAERSLDHMRSLDESAWRLRRMVESMVDMARLDRAQSQPHLIEPLNRVVHRAVDMMQPLAAKKAIALHAEIDESLPATMVDDADFSRVVQNLIENAVNYTPEGGVVTVTTRRHHEYAALEVRDNGIGISSEDLPNIFNRLYRADKARTTRDGGMGLGLAIVKRIVEAHHGKIEVESVPGAGSVFRVCLPIERTERAP